MSRNLTAGWIAEASSPLCRPRFFFQGTFASSTIYYWTGAADVSWNGHTWISNGYLDIIGDHDETSEIRATGLTIQLSGVPTAQIAFALEETFINQDGRIYLGFVDATETGIIADPYLLFQGRLDSCQYVRGPDTAMVQLVYESRFIDLNRSPACRYTDANQKSFYPSDRGFEFVAKLANYASYWGATTNRKFSKKTHGRRTGEHQAG